MYRKVNTRFEPINGERERRGKREGVERIELDRKVQKPLILEYGLSFIPPVSSMPSEKLIHVVRSGTGPEESAWGNGCRNIDLIFSPSLVGIAACLSLDLLALWTRVSSCSAPLANRV